MGKNNYHERKRERMQIADLGQIAHKAAVNQGKLVDCPFNCHYSTNDREMLADHIERKHQQEMKALRDLGVILKGVAEYEAGSSEN